MRPLPEYEKILRSTRDQQGLAINAQITIALDIADVGVLAREINDRSECILTVESTLEGTQCRKGGREIRDFHRVDDALTLRHLPSSGQKSIPPAVSQRLPVWVLRRRTDHDPGVAVVYSQPSPYQSL